jgi:uncharacterized coiled-coil protein SlyX
MATSSLEQKISNLEAELKKQSNYVTEITQTVKKLKLDMANSTNNINILNGAIQAYKDILNSSKATEANAVADGANG